MPRALIIKFGAIGDVIMAIPAAHALHKNGHEITWVSGRTAAPILRLYPWINVLEADDSKLLSGSPGAILKLWKQISGSYDLCATLYYDTRYKLLTLPVRARRKVLLSHTDRATRLLPGRHHTDEYARILLDLPDAETPHQLAPIPVPSLSATPLARTEKKRIVLIAAGARNMMRDDALRRWSLESYVTLAEALLARGHEVVLSGGPDDTWASAAFTPLAISDLTAKLSLVETLALFDSADIVCTHDTGPLHLAGLTRAGIVTIFGPTDPHGRLPQRHNAVALWGGEGFACRPCYDGRDYAPCPHNGCMDTITPTMALNEIETILTAQREGRLLLPRVRVPKHAAVQITPAKVSA